MCYQSEWLVASRALSAASQPSSQKAKVDGVEEGLRRAMVIAGVKWKRQKGLSLSWP